ncbi:MAG TPA: DinB family protein [Thermomicrobiales bacterium]|nr:DinB family protein [Thermomicrobiales bacterium]
MHADDVFRFGHLAVQAALDRLPADAWEAASADADWTAKELLAHLAAYEQLLGDVFASVLGAGATPTLDALLANGEGFNEREVAKRRPQEIDTLRAEYEAAHRRAAVLLARIPVERRRQAGLLAWYGAEYDLEDAIVYMGYGHKTEHAAQLAAFSAAAA